MREGRTLPLREQRTPRHMKQHVEQEKTHVHRHSLVNGLDVSEKVLENRLRGGVLLPLEVQGRQVVEQNRSV